MGKGDRRVLYRFVLRACTFSFALTLALFAVASSAFADAKTEGAAKALESKAMQEDYLATDFDKALEKLNQAASKCGADKCVAIVRAQIKRDIGVVQVAKQSREAAVAAFTEALRADPNVVLDPDTRTKEVDAAWNEAKKQATAAAPAAAAPAGPPAGDFNMQPSAETLVRTPLDIYGDYTGTEQLAKVMLKYKAFGMPDWKAVEMKNLADKGWGAEIPCVDVTEGDLHFYIQGFNANNDPVATAGDRNTPFRTAVKRTLNGQVPHFPGKEPPRQCADAGDCPPDFPGCKKPSVEGENPDSNLKEEGRDCEEDSECKSGTCTKEKTCAAGEGGSSSSKKRKKFWLGFAGAFDFVAIPGGSDVCLLNQAPAGQPPVPPTPVASSNGYYCTVNGQDFPARNGDPNGQENADIAKGKSDKVTGGFAPGNLRLMISFDYAATSNLMVGLRLGGVVNTYNGQAATNEGKAFVPIIAEARGTYVIGKDAIDKAGLAPYLMLAAGVSQYSAEVGVTVISNVTSNPGPSPPLCPRAQGVTTSCTTNAQAWAVTGPGFASLGAGVRYGFTRSVALLFGPRFNLAFGANGTLVSLSPELGMQFGF
jgi:hypothetical protein